MDSGPTRIPYDLIMITFFQNGHIQRNWEIGRYLFEGQDSTYDAELFSGNSMAVEHCVLSTYICVPA